MAFFSPEFIDRVRTANELSQVVGSYNVHLKRAGSNLLGLCPFHNEKTPSFNVRPAEQFFRCFGCGEKGDVFKFVQLMERVEFPEAIRILAERAGIPVEFDNPDAARNAKRNGQVKSSLLWCCSRALDYFEECLAGPEGKKARQYLEQRGFEKETVARWRIGWAPDSWDGLSGFLLKSAKEVDQKEKVLEYALQAGLVRVKESDRNGKKRFYDGFRGRVMFPITDAQARPVAFGGRILEEQSGVGKYINSPEGRLFEKRKVLFGLTQAAKEISLDGEAVVVEGYTDVIMCHQFGIRNVVATLGTALTEDHVALLRRHVAGKGRVVAFFDSDSAGQNATRRAINLFMEQDVPLAVAGGLELKDAGDFLPRYGADAFRKHLKQAEDSFTYLLKSTLGRVSGRDPQALGAAVREVMETVNLCPDAIKRSLMRQQVAAEAGIPEETLPEPAKPVQAAPGRPASKLLTRPPTKGGLQPPTKALDMVEAKARGVASRLRRETRLLKYMCENPEWCERALDPLPPDKWHDMALAELAELVRDDWNQGKPPVIASLQSRVAHPDAGERLADLTFQDTEPLSEKDFSQTLFILVGKDTEEEIRLLREALRQAEKNGDEALALDIMKQINNLKREMRMGARR